MTTDLSPLERVNELETIDGHTPAETVLYSLDMLALYGGNMLRAAENCGVPRTTLMEWRNRYPNHYQAACERHHVEVEARAVTAQREILSQASERVLQAMEAAQSAPDTRTLMELARASQAFETVAGISTQKVLELTGRPTNVTMHVDATQTLKRISTRFGGAVIDAEAIEHPPSRELTAQSDTANARASAGE